MTLEEACKILNRETHRGHETWRATALHTPGMLTFFPVMVATHLPGAGMIRGGDEHLTHFEALAVAERYEQLRVRTMTTVGGYLPDPFAISQVDVTPSVSPTAESVGYYTLTPHADDGATWDPVTRSTQINLKTKDVKPTIKRDRTCPGDPMWSGGPGMPYGT